MDKTTSRIKQFHSLAGAIAFISEVESNSALALLNQTLLGRSRSKKRLEEAGFLSNVHFLHSSGSFKLWTSEFVTRVENFQAALNENPLSAILDPGNLPDDGLVQSKQNYQPFWHTDLKGQGRAAE